jgi:hypothetical protein
MASKFSNSTATLALGMAFLVTPALMDSTSLFAIDSAFAAKGGNGNGNSGGNGNGNGNGGSKSEKSSSAKAEKTEKASTGSTASALGALNAAHASAQAFAHASPKSRNGKIKAYYLANQESITAQATADATDAVALQAAFEGAAPTAVVDAYEALQANPADVTLQDAYTQAITDAALTPEQVTALETAYTDWQNAVEADALAATAEAEAQDALNAAANKTPVSDETKAALDALLVGKID